MHEKADVILALPKLINLHRSIVLPIANIIMLWLSTATSLVVSITASSEKKTQGRKKHQHKHHDLVLHCLLQLFFNLLKSTLFLHSNSIRVLLTSKIIAQYFFATQKHQFCCKKYRLTHARPAVVVFPKPLTYKPFVLETASKCSARCTGNQLFMVVQSADRTINCCL